MLNTNTTARTETARIDREAIANNLPTLAEVLARPVEHIRVAAYRRDGSTPYLRRAEVREIAAPLCLECVQIGDDPRPWYRIFAVMPCGVAPCMNTIFCDFDAPASGISEYGENRFHELCEQVLRKIPLTHEEYAELIVRIISDGKMTGFIGNADILLMAEICKADATINPDLPACMAKYRARRSECIEELQAAADAEERAEEEARRQAEQEARAAEKRAIIRQLLRGGERIGAEYAQKPGIERDIFARLLAEIAQDCGVTIPVKVKGWMFKALAAVDVKNGRCDRVHIWKNGGTHSTTIHRYINLLLQALANGSMEAEACGAAE